MTIRLACWSGPRSISTATMRAWENRPDTRVVDEPLYAWYLAHTGLDHPGRDGVIAAGETDWRRVVGSLTRPWPGGPVLQYQKHMAQHLVPDLPREWIGSLRNVLLIRDPAEVVSSYLRSRTSVVADDIGILQQLQLHVQLGGDVPVVDAADFLRMPDAYLRWLCAYAGVPFTDAMLAWPAGPRESDGVWAPYWYDAVLRSTGFEPYRRRRVELTPEGEQVVAETRPAYERLYDVRLVL
ncbi:MAG TPA: HAD family hydrolase [Nocardioides sp.]|uniref:sulfotransferase-like domain-containing protein n=1 Tax=Nocardioides sp. TaxID=35761 RepID=UPI002E33A2EF|nr:HAD family hydrolase [Nocardioides sp.]HEX3929519.1 HAD family hydrolase [Nocardioides sp.]